MLYDDDDDDIHDAIIYKHKDISMHGVIVLN